MHDFNVAKEESAAIQNSPLVRDVLAQAKPKLTAIEKIKEQWGHDTSSKAWQDADRDEKALEKSTNAKLAVAMEQAREFHRDNIANSLRSRTGAPTSRPAPPAGYTEQ